MLKYPNRSPNVLYFSNLGVDCISFTSLVSETNGVQSSTQGFILPLRSQDPGFLDGSSVTDSGPPPSLSVTSHPSPSGPSTTPPLPFAPPKDLFRSKYPTRKGPTLIPSEDPSSTYT